MNERDTWSHIVIENRATPRRISEQDFREWMIGRPIFVSSVMDGQMSLARAALREVIENWDAEAVMWETLAPQDQHPEQAYIEGVQRSRIFVLLLGNRYGVADQSGYSPTHKEGNEAEALHIPRFLFQPDGMDQRERDGRVVDWVNSLYQRVSAAKYSSADDLKASFTRQMQTTASKQSTQWVKLGQIVFPGSVSMRNTGGITIVSIQAKLRSVGVRQAFTQLAMNRNQRGVSLTFSVQSFNVTVSDININSNSPDEIEVSASCHVEGDGRQYGVLGIGGVTFTSGSRDIGPEEQAEMWVRSVVFGERVDDGGDHLLRSILRPDGPDLNTVLAQYRASGWVAEGITRLYLVESLTKKYGAQFEHFDTLPATAEGVRMALAFRLAGRYNPELIQLEGSIRLLT